MRMLLLADKLGMTTSDYVFVYYYYLGINNDMTRPWIIPGDKTNYTDEDLAARKRIFKVVKMVSIEKQNFFAFKVAFCLRLNINYKC
jgi:hypothetical protein